MYNRSTIISNGSDLIGWSSSTSTVYASVPSALKNKTYNVNDLPGVTVDLVNNCVVEKAASDYIVSVNKTELIKLVDQFVMSVKSQLNTKELLKNGKVLNNRPDFSTKLTKEGRFWGYVITPQGRKGVKINLSAISFYPDSSITGLPVYVYKASEVAAQETITYNHLTAKNQEWQTIDVDITEQSYIGYFQDDLTNDVYTDFTYFNLEVGKYASVVPCTFVSSQLNGSSRPNNIGLTTQEYHPGFNLKLNVKCDITDVLVENIDMFAKPLQYAVAVRVLSDALSSTALNNVTMAEKFREQWNELRLKYNGELNGGVLDNGAVVKGMIDRLALDFSDLDPVCLPAKQDLIIGGRFI
jgi:hypothetical protein